MAVFDHSKKRYCRRKLIPVNVKTLGDHLLLKRIKANLSQPELAQKAGVSTRTVRKWEHGYVCPTEDHWQALAHILRLDSRLPFRLIGVFPGTQEIVEWRWDLNKLVRRNHPWQAQQWISSGFDESNAQRVRSRVFRRALQQKSAGSLDWLR